MTAFKSTGLPEMTRLTPPSLHVGVVALTMNGGDGDDVLTGTPVTT